jgi:hypothetical protein
MVELSRATHTYSEGGRPTEAHAYEGVFGLLEYTLPVVTSGHMYEVLSACFGLLSKLYSINSTVQQLHKKLEFVEYFFRCSHNSTLFSRTECMDLKPFG